MRIPFKNFNLGGIADSDYMGAANSMADLWGFDIHSEVGVIKVNQALTKDSGTTVDDLVLASVPCSDGNTYLFGSSNGKVFKRTSAGVYSVEATVSPSTGSVGILEAKEYQGYIYYATQNKLGRWKIGTAWSTRDDNWQTFDNGDANWHPMLVLNLVLYIGDKNLVAQVDEGVWSADALDLPLPSQNRIKCLGQMGTDLLLGTYVNSNIVATEIYRWNTWSVSFTNSDPIPEVGINSFLPIDNGVIVNAGTKGNTYIYDGSNLDLYKQIKGNWSSTNKAVVHPNAGLNFNGLPLFALSTSLGTPCNIGLYSLGRANRNYPIVLNGENGISTGNLSNIEIGSIVSIGDSYLVTWKDNTVPATPVYGVDKLDLTKKYTGAYMSTRAIMVDRYQLLNYKDVNIAYRKLPDNTGFSIFKKVNSESYEEIIEAECNNDTDRKIYSTDIDINDATNLQIKIKSNVSNNDAPEIEMFEVNVND